MPELPEVQFTIENITPQISSNTIVAAAILHSKVCQPEPAQFIEILENRRIIGLSRHGKWIIFQLEPPLTMLLHLRMSGRLFVQNTQDVLPKYCVAALHLDGGHTLVFSDMRKFGRMLLLENTADFLKKIGPDALSPAFTKEYFYSGLKGTRQKIKPLLLSQRLVAGLGNIYTDEACFAAAIHPAQNAGALNTAEIYRLYFEIKRILQAAIAFGGTSFDAVWAGGGYQKQLQVFHRQGKACPRCGSKIEKIKLAGRSTHFCPKCQKIREA